VAVDEQADPLVAVERYFLTPEQNVFRRKNAETRAGKRVRSGNIAVIEHDDTRREGKGVGSVSPLLTLLRHGVVATTGNRLQIETAIAERLQKTPFMAWREVG